MFSMMKSCQINLVLVLSILFFVVWLAPLPQELRDADIMPLWLHTAAEFFAISVSFLVFAIGWHTYGIERSRNSIMLACGFLAIGLVDLAHTLSFSGMPDFVTQSSIDKAIVFWLVDRVLFAILMLRVATQSWKIVAAKNEHYLWLIANLILVAFIYWIGLYHADIFPQMFISGVGLTEFKITIELIITSVTLISSILFYRQSIKQNASFKLYDTPKLCVATAITVLSELCFIFYNDVSDLFNLLGHFYKIIAYIFIYHSLFVSNVQLRITQLQAITDDIHEKKEILKTIIDNVPAGIFWKDTQAKYLGVNKKFLQDIGLEDVKDLLGKDNFDVFLDSRSLHSTHIEQIAENDFEVIKTGIPKLNNEEILEEIDGKKTVLLMSKVPMHDKVGNIIGILGTYVDITEIKKAQAIAQNANLSKSEFIANMSHEIRTPMNAILGMIRLTLETELNDTQRSYLEKVQRSSNTLLGILNDILDLSKIESGKMEIELTEFNPSQVLREVTELFIPKAQEKNLEISISIDSKIPMTINSDSLRFKQIVSNLIGNAIKFTPEGEIDIHLKIASENYENLLLKVDVCDSGIGIQKNELSKLFESFTQSDATITRKFGGTGLGLSISKQLVELLGGKITVNSEFGKGSVFSFTLPCTAGKSYDWNSDTRKLKNLRVLCIDDNQISVTVLKHILKFWGIYAQSTVSAIDGITKIKNESDAGNPFDLLLLDWKMPELDGLDLIKELERLKLRKNLTIIMLTAFEQDKLLAVSTAKNVHFDAMINKPLTSADLLNAILNAYHHNQENPAQTREKISCYEKAKVLGNANILLVEDDVTNQQVATLFLEKAGLKVTLANHGNEAVNWLENNSCDAVLMDIQMPVMDGYQATRCIREMNHQKELPIIAMTAAALQHDRALCLEAGMNDHISKPINPDLMIDTLIKWIKPKTIENTPEIEAKIEIETIEASKNLADILEGFDLTSVLTMLAGDEKTLIRLLYGFKEKFKAEDVKIQALLVKNQIDEAQRCLHTLKGSSGNLGVMPLHEASSILDAQLKSGHYEKATLNAWQTTFTDVMALISKL
jgi:polar amino acid transport system substrate-binding protein